MIVYIVQVGFHHLGGIETLPLCVVILEDRSGT